MQIDNTQAKMESSRIPLCKCGHENCTLNAMSTFQRESILREYNFCEYFPDLLLKDVPLHYSVSVIYNIFNRYGNEIVTSITIVPGPYSNHFVVKFKYHIRTHTHERLLCVRWALYNNPSADCRLFDIENGGGICVFNPSEWASKPRFGLEYKYTTHPEHDELLYNDPRTVHLYNYMKHHEVSPVVTNDVALLFSDYDKKVEEQEMALDEQDNLEFLCSQVYNNNAPPKLVSDEIFLNDCSDWRLASDIELLVLPDETNDDEIEIPDDKLEEYFNNYSSWEDAVNTPLPLDSNTPTYTSLRMNTHYDLVHEISDDEDDVDDEDDNSSTYTYYSDNYDEYQPGSIADDYDEDVTPIPSTTEADCDDDDEDESNYEYCEIMKGIWHKRPRNENEDPDKLHTRLSNAKSPLDKIDIFWDYE